MGQTKSLNVGLKMARGKYIAVNDADDLSLPLRLEKQLAFILVNSQFAVVGANAFIMDKNGKLTRRFFKEDCEEKMRLNILFDTPVIHGAVLMDKAVIIKHGGYREDIKVCQDYELWSRLLANGVRLINIKDILVTVRYFSQSLSFREGDRQLEENAIIMQTNYKNFCASDISLDQARRQRMFFASPQKLSVEEFIQARDIFITAMHGFSNASKVVLIKAVKSAMIKPYCRQALFFIQAGDFKQARLRIKDFFQLFGFALLPVIFFFLAYTNKTLLIIAKSLFEHARKLRVRLNG